MAITVIGGLLVSTLLTLVVIPVVYDLLDRRSDEYYAERGRLHRQTIEHSSGHAGDAGQQEPSRA
jgi:HAE1 family hydrophobic/amphiphilic exporter-1